MTIQTIAPTVFLGIALIISGCSSGRNEARKHISAEYDKDGKLAMLRYDSNNDGKIDMWSYMNGAQVVRIDIDRNGDGTVDRWEYYGADQKLAKVGFSRNGDGVQDAWSFGDGSGAITRIEISTRHDGKISRIEHYKNEQMVSAEEDSDGQDGLDKWETYDGARLASVAFDTLHRGKPDRRMLYGADGSASMEVDPDGDGTFVALGEDPESQRGQRTTASGD